MTDLEGLQNLKIPTDLTKEQIHEMFCLVHKLTYACSATSCRKKSIPKRLDDLTGWFMAQNFQHQIQHN